MDVIIPTNLVYVLFDHAIPALSFNFIQLFLYLLRPESQSEKKKTIRPRDEVIMSNDDEIAFKMFSAHERLLGPRIRT